MDERWKPLDAPGELPHVWRGSPLERLVAYQNEGLPHAEHERPELVVVTCMDSRVRLSIPRRFAFAVRTGGADVRPVELSLAVAVGVGRVEAIALIGHDDCQMALLPDKHQEFVEGLVAAGVTREEAERRYAEGLAGGGIGDPLEFVRAQAARLTLSYPGALVAPLMYSVESGRLFALSEQ